MSADVPDQERRMGVDRRRSVREVLDEPVQWTRPGQPDDPLAQRIQQRLEEELARGQDDRQRLSTIVQKLRRELARLRGELPSDDAADLPRSDEELHRQLASALARVADAEQKLTAARNRNSNVERELTDTLRRLAAAERSVAAGRAEMPGQAHIPRLERELADSHQRLAAAEERATFAEEYAAMAEKAGGGAAEAATRINELEMTLLDAHRGLEEARARIASLERDAAEQAVSPALAQALSQVEELRAGLNTAESHGAEMERRANSLSAQVQAAERTTAALRAGDSGSLLTDLEAALRRAVDAETEVAAASRQAHAAEASVRNLENRIAELEGQLIVQLNAVEELRSARAATEEQRQRLEAELSAERDERHAAELARDELAGRIEPLAAQLESARADLTAQLEAVKSELAAVTADRDQVQAMLLHERLDQETAWRRTEAEHEAGLAAERAAHAETRAAHNRLSEALSGAEQSKEQALAAQLEAAEAKRADAAVAHRREIERLEAQAAAQIEEAVGRAHDAESRTTEVEAELAKRVSEIERLSEELKAALGQAEANALRTREEAAARSAAEARRQQVEEELEYVRSVVQVGGTMKRRAGLFGRSTPPKPPPPPKRPSAAKTSQQGGDEDVDAVLERRLFGE